jgi:hypothetical protein
LILSPLPLDEVLTHINAGANPRLPGLSGSTHAISIFSACNNQPIAPKFYLTNYILFAPASGLSPPATTTSTPYMTSIGLFPAVAATFANNYHQPSFDLSHASKSVINRIRIDLRPSTKLNGAELEITILCCRRFHTHV